MMAFGAGALLFAVTVELYGHALREVRHGRLGLIEMFTTIGGALAGAAFYLTINGLLEDYLVADGSAHTPHLSPRIPREDSLESERKESSELEEGKKTSSEVDTETTPLVNALKNLHVAECDAATARTKDDHYSFQTAQAEVQRQWQAVKKLVVGDHRSRGRERAIQALSKAEIQHAKSVAYALFLGLLVDGVPEGILMGFLSAEGHLTPVLIISLFVANFPEAFSSASLLIQAEMSVSMIIGMWSSLCCIVGFLAWASCYLLLLAFPSFGTESHGANLPFGVRIGIALVEGITGGAMISCISSVMLPEAFERAGKKGPFYSQSGFMCTSGFLLSVGLKALYG